MKESAINIANQLRNKILKKNKGKMYLTQPNQNQQKITIKDQFFNSSNLIRQQFSQFSQAKHRQQLIKYQNNPYKHTEQKQHSLNIYQKLSLESKKKSSNKISNKQLSKKSNNLSEFQTHERTKQEYSMKKQQPKISKLFKQTNSEYQLPKKQVQFAIASSQIEQNTQTCQQPIASIHQQQQQQQHYEQYQQYEQQQQQQKIITKTQLSQLKQSQRLKTVKTIKTTKTLKSMVSMHTTNRTIGTSAIDSRLEGQKVQEISRGLNSVVWKVKPFNFGGYVIKKRVDNLSLSKSKELEILTQLSGHPFVVSYYQAFKVGHHNGFCLEIFMEYFEQGDLSQRIYLQGSINLAKVKIYAYQIFRGLNFIHSRRIFHRDIKSQNIFVRGNKLVIGDFGSAKHFYQGQLHNSYVCSRSQRAPQLILGNKIYNQKVDMWAAGCVIVQMILGRKLFRSDISSEDLLVQIFKIRGTPTEEQFKKISQNYKNILANWKIPIKLRRKQWSQVLEQPNLDINLKSLLDGLFEYDYKQRMSAIQALSHPYFDQIRNEERFSALKKKYKLEQDFFIFTQDQIPDSHEFLIPPWAVEETRFQQ